MSYRYMRVMVLFDLPTETSADLREYRKFRHYLISEGFLMMQKSVYCKLALNTTVANSIISHVRKNRPMKGLVQLLTLTEKQFSNIEFITGTANSNVLDTDERLVIL